MIPNEISRACLVAGAGEGSTELNAFDRALLSAGIGDLNLVRVSSIMPPHVKLVGTLPQLPKGAFVLVVYSARTSSVPGESLAAAVAVGRAPDGFGVVMEAQGKDRAQAECEARKKVEEAFRMRGLKLSEVQVAAAEHRVSRCGGVVAACLFF
ncbi:MAG: putative pyruvoyl-dependent arginine decarboxylase [Acetothermia bacterium 64_32]|nr:MAG: putative pyruvoyl-dependent arginine decarboxylase [Acetothermia bacterium 64_32]HAF71246.1 arginine decarboxylase, pyruvoyl-dependent [Candidatus Acetothermia bacterium]